MSSARITTTLNIVLLGNVNVGKTYWLKSIVEPQDIPSRRSKLNVFAIEYDILMLYIKNTTVILNFINANAQEKYQKSVEAKIRDTQYDAFVVFYNISNRESFDNVEKYVKQFKANAKQSLDATGLLVGIGDAKNAVMTEEDAQERAEQLGLQSFYAVNPQVDNDKLLMQPLYFIFENSPKKRITIPPIDLTNLNSALQDALDYCKNSIRASQLQDLQAALDGFTKATSNLAISEYSAIRDKCQLVQEKAQAIYNDAYPERVKAAVLGIAAAVLLVTSIVCGVALLFPVSVPMLVGVLAAACAVSAGAGLTCSGISIFKRIESGKYKMLTKEANGVGAILPSLKL